LAPTQSSTMICQASIVPATLLILTYLSNASPHPSQRHSNILNHDINAIAHFENSLQNPGNRQPNSHTALSIRSPTNHTGASHLIYDDLAFLIPSSKRLTLLQNILSPFYTAAAKALTTIEPSARYVITLGSLALTMYFGGEQVVDHYVEWAEEVLAALALRMIPSLFSAVYYGLSFICFIFFSLTNLNNAVPRGVVPNVGRAMGALGALEEDGPG